MATQPQTDPLEPILREAEAELHRRLHEACDAEASDVRTESSDEIRRIEDSLLQAVVAAEQTIALRRQRQQREEEKRDAERATVAAAAASLEGAAGQADADRVSTSVREFCDVGGRQWRAWSVTPGLARPSGQSVRYLGEYQQGWLCFESLQGAARRRLPQYPKDWTSLDDDQLQSLLQRAIAAPERKGGSAGNQKSEASHGAPAAGA
jgi:hypothetical protein